MWRSRRWRLLLNLIDGLPAASHLSDAEARDDELARMQAESLGGKPQAEASRSFAEWTPETELLTLVGDLVSQLIAITVAINSKDGRVVRPEPLPRPKRVLDAIITQLRDEKAEAFFNEINAQREGGV